MTEKQRLIAFKGYVIKGWEIRRGFRVEVQYLEFGFRLRCGMKKLLVLQLSLFIYSNSLKEKTMKENVGVPPLSFFSFHSSPFETPSSSYSKVCFKTKSAHILNTAPYWAAVVAAARRIRYSPTFLPASHTFFSLFLCLGLSWVFIFKNEIFSLSFVWVCCHFAVCVCLCVSFFFSQYVFMWQGACVSLLQCVGGRVSGCMSDRQAPRVTVLLISSPPPALKQHTLPPALPLGWLWVDWGSLSWIFLELNAFYREDGCSISQSLNLFSKTFEIRVSESILSQYPLLCFKL